MESWYPEFKFTEDELAYFDFIESVFRVQHADGQWRKIILTSHQKHFHSNDIALKFEKALNDDVDKSRNTSFTISSIIRLLTGNYHFRNEEVPVTRINDTKVKELFREIKKIVKHMQPIKLQNGELWPFDPNLVQYTSHEVYFPDREVIFIGYPASSSASENIRGLRITRGLNDETNFEREFNNIHTAMRDAKRGSFKNKEGKDISYLQLTYGSTLKGTTNYSEWKDKLKKNIAEGKIKSWRMLSWPVFDPNVFDSTKPIETQIDNLTPIVDWHSKEDLCEKFNENLNTFLEEYMAIRVPSDEVLYRIQQVINCVNTELENMPSPKEGGVYYIGIDVAGEGGDYFSISIFEEINKIKIHRYLYYINKTVDLDEMQTFCEKLLELWLPYRCRIDGNGIGYHLSQYLSKRFKCVECIRGKQSVKIGKNQTVSLKEFLHTNQIRMFAMKEAELLNDDEMLFHYTMWTRNYTAESSKLHGHGDIVISNGLALLPDNWKYGGRKQTVTSNLKEEIELSEEECKEKVIEFNRDSLKNRMSFYRKNKKI